MKPTLSQRISILENKIKNMEIKEYFKDEIWIKEVLDKHSKNCKGKFNINNNQRLPLNYTFIKCSCNKSESHIILTPTSKIDIPFLTQYIQEINNKKSIKPPIKQKIIRNSIDELEP